MSGQATNSGMSIQHLDDGMLRRIFEHAEIAIFVCDPQGRITAQNHRAQQLIQQQRIRRETPTLRDLVPEDQQPEADESLRTLLRSLTPLEFRTSLTSPDGKVVDFAVWLAPILANDGTLDGISVWFHDITARLRLHRSRRKRERLTELGALSGSVAHHYNNLLCCIATTLEVAMNTNTMAATRRSMRRAMEAVSRATQLTQQLLAFAQADHRFNDLADLTETVLYFVDENETRIADHGVALDFQWEVLPRKSIPRDHLLIVLNNLVNNALDAMPDGGTLKIRLAAGKPGMAALTVADTGPGIRSEHLDDLFEPFFTTKGELAGGASHQAGMGLAVVHGLVNEMHGAVAAGNNPGGGARFAITLPLTDSE